MEDLKHIEHDTKTIALNLDQQSLLGICTGHYCIMYYNVLFIE